jgi:hypothetical protein
MNTLVAGDFLAAQGQSHSIPPPDVLGQVGNYCENLCGVSIDPYADQTCATESLSGEPLICGTINIPGAAFSWGECVVYDANELIEPCLGLHLPHAVSETMGYTDLLPSLDIPACDTCLATKAINSSVLMENCMDIYQYLALVCSPRAGAPLSQDAINFIEANF